MRSGGRLGWGRQGLFVIQYTLTAGATDLAVGTGLLRSPIPVNSQFLGSIFSAGDGQGPTGSNAVFDIVNWVGAVQTELLPDPTIPNGADIGAFTVPVGVPQIFFNRGDMVSINIDQVGSTIPGKHVVASLLFRDIS